MSRQTIGLMAITLAIIGYAFFSIFVKFAYAGGLRPFDLLLWRFIVATLVFWLAYPLWRRFVDFRKLSRTQLFHCLFLGALFAAPGLTANLALNYVSASAFTILVRTYPAMVALMSLALGDRISPLVWLAIILAFAGCFFTVGAGADFGGLSLRQAFWPLANALTYSVYVVLNGRLALGVSRITVSIIIITTTCLTVLPVALITGLQMPVGLQTWGALLGLSVVSTIIPITAVLVSVLILGAPATAVSSTLEPILTLALAALLLGDRLAPVQLVGGTLVVISILIIQLPKLRRKPTAQVPLPDLSTK